MWLAEEKSTGAFVGEFGFFDSKREMEPSIEGFPEVGWVLAPSAWGKGLASEGLQAVLDWGDVHLPARRTVCIIDPEHAASLRVAAKCGFKKVVPTTYAGRPTVLHERWAP
jgi:RimJ/RimL family protein N-acetyltransferase